MIEFQSIDEPFTQEDWDKQLFSLADYNFQQIYSYGEHSENEKSKIRRFVLKEDRRTLVMAQGELRKTLFGGCMLVIRGGPVYQSTNDENLNLKFLRMFFDKLFLTIKSEFKYCYISMIIHGERSVTSEIVLRELGLSKPFFERAPYITYMVPLSDDLSLNLKNFSSKWRNQLKKAESQNPTFILGNDASLIQLYVDLHNEMCRIKSIESFKLSYNSIRELEKNLGDKLQFLIGYSRDEAVCGCMVYVTNKKAYYYYAAANEKGRKGYYSNAMVWNLFKQLQRLGVVEIDMSAVDPVRNWGGYHFKRGTGGKAYAYAGEWDFCTSQILKLLLNTILFWRSKRMYR